MGFYRGDGVIFKSWFKDRDETIDRRRSLDGIPVFNQNVSFETNETGRVVINAKIMRGKGLLARFKPPVMERNVKLDEIGSYVFKLIDNQRSTLEIINLFLGQLMKSEFLA